VKAIAIGDADLYKSLLDELAASRGNYMPLPRSAGDATPALGHELGFSSRSLQPVFETAIHSRDWEPHLRYVQLQEGFELRKAQRVLLNQTRRPSADDVVEMGLQFVKHFEQDIMPVLLGEHTNQVDAAVPFRHVHWLFATGVP
jgi:hypothetical protein